MKKYAPDYYQDFKCLAGACAHSCCKGWEVDIDPDTLAYYKTVSGDMGKRLQAAICEGETPHFAMTAQGDCPFLNSCGLCDIMIHLGMDKVNRICDEHPRFYNFYTDRQEVGLGLACEAVARLLVQKQSKTTLVCLEDDGAELLWEDECDFLDFREDVFDILQNRDTPVTDRLTQLLAARSIQLPALVQSAWADIFLALERLDEGWTALLTQLKTAPLQSFDAPWYQIALEQLAVYLVYRHLADGFDAGDTDGALALTAAVVGLIDALCRMLYSQRGTLAPEDMAEICRMYSAEIEYSDENVEKLIAAVLPR